MRQLYHVLALLTLAAPRGAAQGTRPPVTLTWVTNSSVKLEQIIGDYDWADLARGKTNPTTSLTATRFHILGNGLGCSFEDQGRLIFLFGDTISENTTNWNYHGADPVAWSTNTDGESGLLLNFFTNNPVTKLTPVFVQAAGIKMGPFDVPNSGIGLSNGAFLVCNTGSDANLPDPQTNDFSVLVSFHEAQLPVTTNLFTTNRIISMLSTNLDPRDPRQGHFINASLHEYGTNVLMFGTGEYRSGDVFLCMTPTATFASGQGVLFFAGLTNGRPTWSTVESNCVPVVQDNPTNGPPWPHDSGTVGNVSVIFPPALGLWLMTYDGGRGVDTKRPQSTGIYFTYASEPWGPWSTPQLIFNKVRDHGWGVFIHDPYLSPSDGLNGPVIGGNDPTNTPGGEFAPMMIERFTRVTNSTLSIYYTLSTWNPYTVVKMRSQFTVAPRIDPATLAYEHGQFGFAWSAPTNATFQLDYSDVLPPVWTTLPTPLRSIDGLFHAEDDGSPGAPLGGSRFYRLRAPP